MLYCLLRWKTMATYNRVFCILHLELGLSPVTISTDFEKAAIQAFQPVFPAAASLACFFHLNQSMQRKVHDIQSGQVLLMQARDKMAGSMSRLECINKAKKASIIQTHGFFIWYSSVSVCAIISLGCCRCITHSAE